MEVMLLLVYAPPFFWENKNELKSLLVVVNVDTFIFGLLIFSYEFLSF